MLHELGYEVTGIDPSESGIEKANEAFPQLDLSLGTAYDDLAGRFGTFPIVLSLEVIEHCYSPRKFAQTAFDLLDEGGLVVISTPYHGYVKNLALSVLGRWDFHFGALNAGGHIKFFSRQTLGMLLADAGFGEVDFTRVGRIPLLARSMIARARRLGREHTGRK
jgi:2-polyprenyl-6-hydroxyphenyl methylase/3-demethylubiquinone-9 3-methyltransferase